MQIEKLINNLNIIEQELLYSWGCSDYELTITKLQLLKQFTVDPMMKQRLDYLRYKLMLNMDQNSYSKVYFYLRIKLHNGMMRKQQLAEQLLRLNREESK